MDGFDEITAELHAADRWEQEEQARELLAAADASTDFAAWLRGIPRGEVVTLVTTDGAVLRGRIGSVGRDWMRFLEVADGLGTARCVVRGEAAVRFDAVARISREGCR
jgi:hypothetical protein